MTAVISGRAWVFGDNVNTDVMAPGLYFKSPMSAMAKHCMEAVNPDFASQVQPGDIVVGGKNFGIGSAREQAAMALQYLGVGAVLAPSFGRIFYRNTLNFGIPALRLPADMIIEAGDQLHVEPETGRIRNESRGTACAAPALPPHLLQMVTAGGLMPYLKARLAKENRDGR
ncbi:MAG: 3-isopropylmalate dehydratase small subunit [Chromatiales bacterium]|nr:MAG: 3-isopropylmalate dehydratase small subunit [Chromatiales bacterium]